MITRIVKFIVNQIGTTQWVTFPSPPWGGAWQKLVSQGSISRFVGVILLGIAAMHLQTTPLFAQTIYDLNLKSPSSAPNFVTLQIAGRFENTCEEVTAIDYGIQDELSGVMTVDVYVTSQATGILCREVSQPFVEDVYLGALPDGTYLLRIHQNNLLVIEREVNVPEDVTQYWLDQTDGLGSLFLKYPIGGQEIPRSNHKS